MNDGWVVYGLDTDPVEVAAQTGAASFSGQLEATLRRSDFQAAFGAGDFTMQVDFDDMSIDGRAVVNDLLSDTGTFAFDPIFVTFEDTDITGNAFAGDLSIQSGSYASDIAQAGYQGNLFGIDVGSVGGTAQAVLTPTASNEETFMILGFVGDRAAD